MQDDLFWDESNSENNNSEKNNESYYQENNISNFNISDDDENSNSEILNSSSSSENKFNKNKYKNKPIQIHKSSIHYKLNPKNLPRPSFDDIIYSNIHQNNIYYSGNDYQYIPSPNSNYINYEKGCSSIRLIRPSMFYLPYNIKFYNETIKYFGFNIEPFGNEKKEFKDEKILYYKLNIDCKYNKKCFKCEVCKAYYNPKLFEIYKVKDDLYYTTYTYVCKICLTKKKFYTINNNNILDINYEKFINTNDIYLLPNIINEDKDKIVPSTIDYILEEEKIEYNIKEIIIIYLDISNNSVKYGFISYIIESLINILNNNNENDFEYIIATYDNHIISYFYIINNTIKICNMNDKKNPFFPKSINSLKNNNKNTIKIIEKIQSIIKDKNIYEMNNELSNLEICIKSANNISEINLFNYFYNILIFSSNNSHFSITNSFKINKQISFTFFISSGINIKTFPIHLIRNRNLNFHFYIIDFSDSDDYIQKFERLYYDIYNIISNIKSHIYNVTYKLIYSKKIFNLNEEKINEGNNIISIINNFSDFNIVYPLQQNTYFSYENQIYFQFQISYLSPKDNKKHIRILYYQTKQIDSIERIFSCIDTNTLLRILFQKHFDESKNINDINEILKIKENILNDIYKLFAKYKSEIFFGNNFYSLSYPISLRNILIYLFSFFERVENNLITLIYLYRTPLDKLFLQIYPFLFKITYDDIFLDGLSYFFLKMKDLLLLDDGYYLTLYILKDVKKVILNKYFHVDSFEKLIQLKQENNLNFDLNELDFFKNKYENKPIKIILVDDNYITNPKFTSIFIEDRQTTNQNYSQFIFECQNNIAGKLFEL